MKRIGIFIVTLLVSLVLLPGCGKPDGETAKEEVKSNAGGFLLTSKPSGAKVTMLGRDVGTTPKEAPSTRAGVYIAKLEKEGYSTEWVKVPVQAGKKSNIEVTLNPLVTSALVSSIPAGADLEMDGKPIGKTPCVVPNLYAGKTYNFTLGMPLYSKKTITLTVPNDRPINLMEKLSENTAQLSVKSTPSDAELFINGTSFGLTPSVLRLEIGKHTVRVVKQGHKPFETTVQLTKEGESVHADLSVLPATLEVTSTPSGAQLFINNQEFGTTPMKKQELKPGTYVIRCVKDGFDPAERTLTIPPGNAAEVELLMTANTGGIDFVVHPPGVSVYLDGKFIGKTKPDPGNPSLSQVFSLRNLSAGKHRLEIAHKRATPNKRTIDNLEIRKGEVTRIKNAFTMWIPNAVLVLKTGQRYTGRIVNTAQGGEIITFEPEPTIKYEYKRSELTSVTMLKDEDDVAQ